jgi:uncharacterized protein (TIGR02679 family)
MSDEGLARLAADPGLARLWADAHERWCELGGCRGSVTVRVNDADAVRRLLGRPSPQAALSLSQLASCLRGAGRLRRVLEIAVGPLEDRRGARADKREQRARIRDQRLADWQDCLPGQLKDVAAELHADRPRGLPELSDGIAEVLARAFSSPSPSWRTFADLGVKRTSATWQIATELVAYSHPGADAAHCARLVGHRAEAFAREHGAGRAVIAFCARYGGRQPLAAVNDERLPALIDLLGHLHHAVTEPGRTNGILLAVLAAERFGDPHTLDRSQPCGEAAAQFCAECCERPRPRNADEWATTWARASVDIDAVSSRVLVAGLEPVSATESPLGELLYVAARSGQELSLSLRHLRTGRLPTVRCRRVLVVENPPVFEALLDRRAVGANVGLLCSMGLPRLACLRVVAALVSQGVDVIASADQDRGGSVARLMLERAGARSLTARSTARYEEQRLEELAAWLSDDVADFAA